MSAKTYLPNIRSGARSLGVILALALALVLFAPGLSLAVETTFDPNNDPEQTVPDDATVPGGVGGQGVIAVGTTGDPGDDVGGNSFTVDATDDPLILDALTPLNVENGDGSQGGNGGNDAAGNGYTSGVGGVGGDVGDYEVTFDSNLVVIINGDLSLAAGNGGRGGNGGTEDSSNGGTITGGQGGKGGTGGGIIFNFKSLTLENSLSLKSGNTGTPGDHDNGGGGLGGAGGDGGVLTFNVANTLLFSGLNATLELAVGTGATGGNFTLNAGTLEISPGSNLTMTISGELGNVMSASDRVAFETLLLNVGSSFTTAASVFAWTASPAGPDAFYQVRNLDVRNNATWSTEGTYAPNTVNGGFVRFDLSDIEPGQEVLTLTGGGSLALADFDPWGQQKTYLVELRGSNDLFFADNPDYLTEVTQAAFLTSAYQSKSRDLGTLTLVTSTTGSFNTAPTFSEIRSDGNRHIISSVSGMEDIAGDLFDDFAFTSGLRRYYWDVYVDNNTSSLMAHNHMTADATDVYSQAGAAPGLSLNQTFQTTLRAFDNVSEDPEVLGRITVGLYFAGSDTKTETGSGVDLDNYSGTLLISQTNEAGSALLTVGAFAEFARGAYQTDKFVPMYGEVFGEGDVNTYGGGVLVKATTQGGTFVEGSLRAGVIDNDFRISQDPWAQNPLNLHSYKTENSYFGAHFGLGQSLFLSDYTNVEAYGRFLWTRTGRDEFRTRFGDDIRLEAVDSARVRAGARLNQSLADNMVKFYIGAAAEWELDGKVKGTSNGARFVRAADTEGTSGFGEAGFLLTPIPGGNFSLNAQVFGWTGHMKGGGGSASLNFSF